MSLPSRQQFTCRLQLIARGTTPTPSDPLAVDTRKFAPGFHWPPSWIFSLSWFGSISFTVIKHSPEHDCALQPGNPPRELQSWVDLEMSNHPEYHRTSLDSGQKGTCERHSRLDESCGCSETQHLLQQLSLRLAWEPWVAPRPWTSAWTHSSQIWRRFLQVTNFVLSGTLG